MAFNIDFGISERLTQKSRHSLYAENGQEYRDGLGLSPKGIFHAESTAAFDTLAKGKSLDIKAFENTKGPKDVEVYKKLQATSAEAVVVQTALKTALKPSDEFDKAGKNYRASVKSFEKLCLEVPAKLKAEALAMEAVKTIDKARTAITTQHTDETKKMEDLFKDPVFTTNLKATLGTTTDADFELVKKNMLTDLKASQEKQLTDFDKETQQSKNQLLKAIQVQALEYSTLLLIAKMDPSGKMTKHINEIAEENRLKAEASKSNTNVTISFGEDPNKVDVAGVTAAQIKVITSVTGSDIAVTASEDNNHTYTLQFGRRLFNPSYYYHPIKSGTEEANVLTDVYLMAKMVRLQGHEDISVNVSFKDPALAMERARIAYEACILVGYPPDKIHLKSGSQDLDIKEVFKGHEGKLSTLNGHAATHKSTPPLSFDKYKTTLKDGKAAEAAMNKEVEEELKKAPAVK